MNKLKRLEIKKNSPRGLFFGYVHEGRDGEWRIGPEIYKSDEGEYYIGSNPYDVVRVDPKTVREMGDIIGKKVLLDE